MRCLCQGVHLIKCHPAQSSTKLGHEMSLWGVHLTTGLCDQSSHTWPQYVSAQGWVRLTFCAIGSQPANQLASCNWPVNQPCGKISTCQAVGWSDSLWQEDREPDHIGSLVQGPSTPTGSPWGVTYLIKAKQVTQMSSAAHYIPLALLSGTICSFVSTSPNHIFLH